MGKVKVFVSSAMAELEYEREIARRVIESLNLQSSMFEGLPPMSKELEDAYLDEVRNCDIFVLLLWKSLRPAVLREYEEAQKANKPILIFVKLLREDEKRDRKLTAFLGKIKKTNEEKGAGVSIRFYKPYRSLGELETELKRGIVGEIERKFTESVIVTSTRQGLYELAVSIVQFAHRRLYIMQRTPSLFFPSKGYFETEFRDSLADWVEKARRDKKREFMYLYYPEKTTQEIQKHRGQVEENIGQIIRQYKMVEEESDRRIRFSSLPKGYQGPVFGAGDNRFAIWFTGEESPIALSYVNEKMADGFVKIFKELGSRVTTAEDLLRELGLE